MDISLTIDLEDPTLRYDSGGRYDDLTRAVLDLCDATACKATFFTVGRLAQASPWLIRDIAAKGHEIAYHTHDHVPLMHEEPQRFRLQSREDKDFLEQLTGTSVIGFRAPCYSLIPRTVWALDVLCELGFRYSSSIMPTDISLTGFPGAPRTPFRWPCGMIELPLPVAEVGKYRLPYLGGIYLYTMPFFLVRSFLKRAHEEEILWTYAHPYDFDKEKNFFRLPNTPLWISAALHWGRLRAEKKIKKVLETGVGKPLAERLNHASSLVQISLP